MDNMGGGGAPAPTLDPLMTEGPQNPRAGIVFSKGPLATFAKRSYALRKVVGENLVP
jgi:hypothetical protein